MLSAIGLEKPYHTPTEKIACSRESKICMIHQCENCQGVENVEQFLHGYLNPNDPNDLDDNDDADDAEENEIECKQWTMTDQTELKSIILPQNEFINLLVQKLDNNILFYCRSQGSYLKQPKNMIGADEVIVLGDFAENYSFLVQDEIHHWNRNQLSLHPVAVYIRSSDKLLCILSEDLNHDVALVETVNFTKKE